jgi:hypothetical protein
MKKNSLIKAILFVLTMLLLVVFLVQKQNGIFEFKPLKGVNEPTLEPHFTWDSYRNAEYQTQLENYLSEHYGFREPLIRFYNQFLYDFFRKTYSEEVVIGKDYWSYFVQHVNEYYGTEMHRWYDSKAEACADFDREARLMWKLRGVLQDYGIEFLMFMAPDKGFLYPEHLPDRKFDTTTVNAREYYSAKFDEYGFPYIEMTKWFIELKQADTLPYSLMPQAGAHWCFSAVLAADSLFRFMGNLNGQRLPELKIGPLHESTGIILQGDSDLEEILNLMRPLPHHYDRLYEAEVTVVKNSATIWPSVLFVGNSFLWRMHTFIPFDDMFYSSEYWFYNSKAHFGTNYSQKDLVGNLDILQKILDNDYVVWFTDGNQMYKVSYGFVEQAMMALCVSDDRVKEVRGQLMDSLSHDSLMMAELGKSNETKRQSNFWNRANALIIKDPEKYFPEIAGDSIPTARNPRIPEALAIKGIKRDTAWMKNLQCQTVIRNASLEEVLKMEAQNILNNRPLMRDEQDVVSREVYVEGLVKTMIEEMRNKPNTMKTIKEKAEANGLSLEEQLEADARWIVNDQIKRGLIVL